MVSRPTEADRHVSHYRLIGSIFLAGDLAGTKLDRGAGPGVERQVLSGLRRTKIVVTLGPATSEPTVLRSPILAGAEVMRLNFSHGTHAEKQAQIESARGIAAELERPVAILQDLQGPKIRLAERHFKFTARRCSW